MSVIVVGGMIGLGKSSVSKILGEALGSEVFYEKVEGNRVLEKFYTASDEEIQAKRYPFLLQLEFLGSRFRSIKEALVHQDNVLDRSIYEDMYFAQRNYDLGRISELELTLYKEISEEMLKELDELPKKSPDLMVYLKGSFETVLERINKRGRGYELAPELVEYYKFLWEDYDNWIHNYYKASDILVIDMDKMDVVNNPEDADKMVEMVKDKLKELRADKKTYISFNCEMSDNDVMDVVYYEDDNSISIENVEDGSCSTVCLDTKDTKKLKDFINKNVR